LDDDWKESSSAMSEHAFSVDFMAARKSDRPYRKRARLPVS
jgi:hypothetical protein